MTEPAPVRPSFDEYFAHLAAVVALRGDCSRRQVGAVIVGRDNRIVSTGYNGSAPGQPGCLTDGACPRGRLPRGMVLPSADYETTRCIALHAEMNAIAHASYDRTCGATIYVTDEPCYLCVQVIAAAGISRVVWDGQDEAPASRGPVPPV